MFNFLNFLLNFATKSKEPNMFSISSQFLVEQITALQVKQVDTSVETQAMHLL